MLILGNIMSIRDSGSNVFCTLKKRQSMLPKRFALRMSRDFACFLFKLRNAGAYIPKGTPCTLHVSIFYRTCRLKAEETCSHSHQGPVRPWSSLAMPRCQRSSWPLFGARAEERVGQQKSAAKTQKNESLRKQDGTNLKDSHSKTS